MGDKTGIEWTDATWNPLRGCSRVSDGCRNCYAESVAHRFSGPGMPYEGLTRIVNGQFFFKQWGEWIPGSQTSDTGNQTALVGACQHGHRLDNGTHSWRIGKKAAGRLLDGVPHDEYPEDKS